MALLVTPESGVPMPDDLSPVQIDDTLEAARLACRTASLLDQSDGWGDLVDEDDNIKTAHEIFQSVTAPNPLPLPPQHFAKYPTEALKKVDALLSEYDREVVDIALRLRHYVTNKLVVESNNAESKTRLRALELLGKIKEVGLFVDRREVVINHGSVEEIEQELRRKLEKFMGPAEVINAEILEEGQRNVSGGDAGGAEGSGDESGAGETASPTCGEPEEGAG